MRMFSKSIIQKEYPTWSKDALDLVETCEGFEDTLKVLVFLGSPCLMCKKDMGEHTWDNKRKEFVCH